MVRMNLSGPRSLSLIESGVGVNIVAAAIPLTLLYESTGSAIRPMGHTAGIVVWALFSFVTIAPRALIQLFRKQWRVGFGALILSVFPIVVSVVTFFVVVAIKGFDLKP